MTRDKIYDAAKIRKKIFLGKNACMKTKSCTFAAEIWLSGR
jgi:hypothetical protein